MQPKHLAKTSKASNVFNSIVSSRNISNLALKNSLARLDTQTKINIVSQSSLNKTQMLGALASAGLSKEELKDAITKIENTTATDILTASQTGTTVSTIKLSTAFKGLNIAVKNTTCKNTTGSILF